MPRRVMMVKPLSITITDVDVAEAVRKHAALYQETIKEFVTNSLRDECKQLEKSMKKV